MSKRKLNVLVACESSATVRDAFRKRGHNAWSCDLLPCDGDPRYHVQGDVLAMLRGEVTAKGLFPPSYWDLMIAHPPCTYLCNSGVRWLISKKNLSPGSVFGVFTDRHRNMKKAAQFFHQLWSADIPHIAVENPIMHRYARVSVPCNYTQLIQPYMFGHLETKATCLWLKNLPKLLPTVDVVEAKRQTMLRPKSERNRIHMMAPSKDRWKQRSKTFQGIADAMAEQWSKHIIESI